MQLGVDIPNEGDLPLELGVTKMAVAAEEAGADSLWANDHLVMVDHPDSRYPYSPDGRIPWDMDRKFFDTLITCSFMAAVTRRCRVGTDVLILPQRNVLELAKAAATIDVLSGGRFVLAVGLGWFRKEMEALGYSFTTRARRADEMIEVLRRSWTGRPEPFDGREIQVGEGVVMQPRPAQPGGVPILVGGVSPPAYRRAARLGDGWMGVANLDAGELREVSEALVEIDREREAAGRMDQPFRRVLKLHTPLERMGAVPGALRDLAGLDPGFDEIIIQPFWESIDQGVDCIRATHAVLAESVGSV
jgi:probable F420-dependent oxidoreductase